MYLGVLGFRVVENGLKLPLSPFLADVTHRELSALSERRICVSREQAHMARRVKDDQRMRAVTVETHTMAAGRKLANWRLQSVFSCYCTHWVK